MDQTTRFGPPSEVEAVKEASRGLRGTLRESVADPLTGGLAPDDRHLIKFHGIYQQDDRDRREERDRKRLERDWSFMIRLRIPGGEITPSQWLAIQRMSGENGTGVVKITSRQTAQIHGVLKSRLKPTLRTFHKLGLDSIAACGDVNRNVMAGVHPSSSPFHREAFRFAEAISRNMLPRTRAWYEIWLDDEKLGESDQEDREEDPLYQDRYLPRKFKVGIAVPPYNDADVFSNDVGLIAVGERGRFTGFNVAAGGGMGMTHDNPETYPRLATILGYAPKEKVLEVVWQIAAVQRDFGNRSDRKLARLKYTLARMGIEAFREELERRTGFPLEAERPWSFTARRDLYGWEADGDGRWCHTLFVEGGRVLDRPGRALRTALMEIAEGGKAWFRFTPNQNIMLSAIATPDRAAVEEVLIRHGVSGAAFSPLRLDSLACVALNTCPLALAEAQRYLPALVDRLEGLLETHGLSDEPISIRMTGCPNGCARPHLAEIGLIGRAPGIYDLYLGGDALGTRLNRLHARGLDEEGILRALDGLFAAFAAGRKPGEGFGDFIHRTRGEALAPAREEAPR